jgi:hypothetical protein
LSLLMSENRFIARLLIVDTMADINIRNRAENGTVWNI